MASTICCYILTSATIRLFKGDTCKRNTGNDRVAWSRFIWSGEKETRSEDCTKHVLSLDVLFGLISNMQDTTCFDMTQMPNQDKVDWLVPEIQSILQQPGLLNEVLRPQIVGGLVNIGG